MRTTGLLGRRPRVAAGLAVLLLLAAGTAGCGGQGEPSRASIRLSACTVQGVAARCGTYPVAEDRLSDRGRRMGLRVVVVPAETAHPRPDPLVVFAGGPGDAATDLVADVVGARTGRDRDLVFVDQRGTGGSHRLTCPSPEPGPWPWPRSGSEVEVAAYVASCLDGLDGDPRFYTTAMAADDVADVLAALGVRRANLFGGSYGATTAQVFLRRHADLVRTMTLVRGSLLGVPVFERDPVTSQAALDDVFGRCGADPACSAAFPRLPEDWQRVLTDLSAAPVTVPAERAPDGQTFVLTAELMAGVVHQLLMSADSAAQIPWLVHTLASATDRVAAALTAAELGDVFGRPGTFLVMQYAIRCNEAWARFDPAAVAVAGRGSYYAGLTQAHAQYWQRACAAFPPAGEAAEPGAAVAVDTPVLLLNGSVDPQNPPSNVAGAARLWPNSRSLVEPHQAHSITQWECEGGIVGAFIRSASVAALPTDCLAGLQPAPFVLSR